MPSHKEGQHPSEEHGNTESTQERNLSRRQFVNGVVAAGAAAAGLTMISPILNFKPLALAVKTIAPGDILAYDSGSKAGQPILSTDLKEWEVVSALPSSGGKLKKAKNNYVELMKIPAELLTAPTIFKAKLTAFQLEHAGGPKGAVIPWTEHGIVAYSAICTHLGCIIEAKIRTRADGVKYVLCPCHGSEYDALAGMKVVHPPAPRPVPQLPIKIDNKGQIVVEAFFEGKVGPS